MLNRGPSDPAPFPDGSTVARSARGYLWLYDETSGRARGLTRGRDLDFRPRWSPDGKRLVFVRDRGDETPIVLIDVVSGEEQVLVDESALDLDPAFSPDGSSVFYSSAKEGAPSPSPMASLRTDFRSLSCPRRWAGTAARSKRRDRHVGGLVPPSKRRRSLRSLGRNRCLLESTDRWPSARRECTSAFRVIGTSPNISKAFPVERVEVLVNGKVVFESDGLGAPGKKRTQVRSIFRKLDKSQREHAAGESMWPAMDSYSFAHSAPIWIGKIGSLEAESARASAKALLAWLDVADQRLGRLRGSRHSDMEGAVRRGATEARTPEQRVGYFLHFGKDQASFVVDSG